jgi:hypothetical protein
MLLRRWPVLAALLVLSTGCDSGPYKTARVSGRVTLNGSPLADAAVTFQPVATKGKDPGPGSGGVTDADGRYTLTLVGKTTRGAVVGKHKVLITMYQKDDPADDRPKPVKRLPKRYNSKTELQFEVPSGGSDSADFNLKAP